MHFDLHVNIQCQDNNNDYNINKINKIINIVICCLNYQNSSTFQYFRYLLRVIIFMFYSVIFFITKFEKNNQNVTLKKLILKLIKLMKLFF
jgi:hypothetical protein